MTGSLKDKTVLVRVSKDHGRCPWRRAAVTDTRRHLNGDAAALEMERHLRGLLYVGRLTRATVSEAVT